MGKNMGVLSDCIVIRPLNLKCDKWNARLVGIAYESNSQIRLDIYHISPTEKYFIIVYPVRPVLAEADAHELHQPHGGQYADVESFRAPFIWPYAMEDNCFFTARSKKTIMIEDASPTQLKFLIENAFPTAQIVWKDEIWSCI